MINNNEVLLRVENLKMHFPIYRGVIKRQVGAVHAVDGISFNVYKGETLGLVGESGCGKSTTGRTILQLYKPTAGDVYFKDKNLVKLKSEPMRMMRREMQMIFQDPYASLNPRMTVRDIVGEPLTAFGEASGKQIDKRVAELLDLVRLNPDFSGRYPHEFSGGQRQRIGVARALALNPSFIVCDEPISALDVSIQAQVVNLLEDLQKEFNLTYLFIAHDLSMVRHISDRVAVMYLGVIVELADRNELYRRPSAPLHPGFAFCHPGGRPCFQRTTKTHGIWKGMCLLRLIRPLAVVSAPAARLPRQFVLKNNQNGAKLNPIILPPVIKYR